MGCPDQSSSWQQQEWTCQVFFAPFPFYSAADLIIALKEIAITFIVYHINSNKKASKKFTSIYFWLDERC